MGNSSGVKQKAAVDSCFFCAPTNRHPVPIHMKRLSSLLVEKMIRSILIVRKEKLLVKKDIFLTINRHCVILIA